MNIFKKDYIFFAQSEQGAHKGFSFSCRKCYFWQVKRQYAEWLQEYALRLKNEGDYTLTEIKIL